MSEAAARLGVARSTAHRLLAMLVYRDFAEQDEDRRYVAGPVLRAHPVSEPLAELRRIALPHLASLTARTAETSNLVVVISDQVRFVATVECDQVLRVGDREGRVLPARLASGGRTVPAPPGPLPAAISLAMPTARYRRDRLAEWSHRLARTAEAISRDLEEAAEVRADRQ
ncbi:helix-turn-helix domain-containing protein [Pseudonocardia sp. DLS-67]